MLTGIMAIFQMATSFVQFQNTWRPASEAQSSLYYKGLHLKDQHILSVIVANPDMDICKPEDADDVMERFQLENYVPAYSVPDFAGGCSYSSDSSRHRIIFDSSKGLWSCSLPSTHVSEPNEKCDFEV